MKKSNDDLDDQQWFEDHITEAVSRFDAVHAPHIPEALQFEALVEGHKKELRRRLWKELLLLSFAACVVLSLMLWMTAERNLVFFVIFQASIAAIGIGISSAAFGRGKVRKWRS
ncbi:hypothetical protein BK133_12020 [Paenibacillus sp. FSL H8-0548]|uniref:DUF5345 family protein n=1 Tax=Paenibacillus sp. FSL H8-0548 TaxID=1920422 RepID=UPI00096D065C|nr:DUF5345 family protein [Paenibacillus sp. FSL H8-0548]OMF34725.1 hypothetical protein BK133_12020 [Paenibacillus sp. FSL H8-0548]